LLNGLKDYLHGSGVRIVVNSGVVDLGDIGIPAYVGGQNDRNTYRKNVIFKIVDWDEEIREAKSIGYKTGAKDAATYLEKGSMGK